MNLEAVVAYCLAMPGAEETYPFGDHVLVAKVGGKGFAFIGAKLFLHALHEYHVVPDWLDINNWVSLGVIIVVLSVTTVASLAKARRDERKQVAA